MAAMVMLEFVGLNIVSVPTVLFPITSVPRSTLGFSRTRPLGRCCLALTTPQRIVRVKARVRQLLGVCISFTETSCEPHSNCMRRGICINRLRPDETWNSKQQGQFPS